MRLLTVGNLYPPQHLGGYEVVWHSAVEHMRARGHEVTVLTTDSRVRDISPVEETDVHRTLRWYWSDHEFASVGRVAALSIERQNAKELDRLLAGGYDAVLWWAMGGMSLGLIGRAARAGVVSGAVVHDAWPVYGQKMDGWIGRSDLPARTLRGVARVAGVSSSFSPSDIAAWSFNSRWVRDGLLDRIPEVNAADCRVDYPGVDPARFGTADAHPWSWRLACVGRVEARKGVDVAITALAALPPQATLVVSGGGPESLRSELMALAQRLGVADRVTFTGPVDDVAAVYEACDALVFPVTWDEPFGLVPLEAMAVGRPVLATGTGGSAEYLADGRNCLLTPPGDAAQLASAIRRLAGEEGLRGRLTDGGRATARQFAAGDFDAAIEDFALTLAVQSAP